MKRGAKFLLVLTILIVTSLIGIVSAQTCLPEQVIMKLYQQTNSHGALWNFLGNNWDICYSEIFGTIYQAAEGQDPHECKADGSNRVLSLFDVSNAHASVTHDDINYKNDVCYGDLVCRAVVDPTSCAADEKTVVRLYQETNSHLSDASDTNYPIKICCKSGVMVPSGAYWANMLDEKIGNDVIPIIKAQKGDTVKMIWENTGLDEGTQVSFEIYEKDAIINDPIRTGTEAITASVNSDRDAVATWTITQKDINKAKGLLGLGDLDNFIFKVRTQESNELTIETIEKNSPPEVEIISPEDKEIYFLGEEINFEAIIFDEDDGFNYVWDLGDRITKEGTNLDLQDNIDEFFNTYLTTGQKNIVLNVTDDRGAISTDKVSILVIDATQTGKYVFAFIDKPEFLETYENPVLFEGNNSFAIEVTAILPLTINCIGGNCPATTTSEPQITINNAPASIEQANYNSLYFLWEFSKDNWLTKLTSYPEDGTALSGIAGVSFNRAFASSGKHYTKLNVSLAPESSSFANSEFFVKREGECKNNGFIWVDKHEQEYDTILTNICGAYTGAETCCPSGYSCQDDPDKPNEKKCLPVPNFCEENDIKFCADYDNAEDCNPDKCSIGIEGGLEWNIRQEGYAACGQESVIGGATYSTSCIEGCYWDSGDEDGKCKFRRNFMKTTNPNPLIPTQYYKCLRETIKEETKDYYLLGWTENRVMVFSETGENIINLLTAEDRAEYQCKDGSMRIRKMAKLIFFTLTSLILTIILIIIIYFILIKKRRIKGRTKKRK